MFTSFNLVKNFFITVEYDIKIQLFWAGFFCRVFKVPRYVPRCPNPDTGGHGLRSCYHAVLPEYTPVRKPNRAKIPPFSLVIIIGPGSTKLRRVEFWLAT